MVAVRRDGGIRPPAIEDLLGVALAEDRAVVLARAADGASVGMVGGEPFAGEILGRADVLHVLVERPALGEAGGGHDGLAHTFLLEGSEDTSARASGARK